MDPQSRVVVPQKFREALESGAILARGIDGCIEVYPPVEWEQVAARVKRFSPYERNARILRRLTFSGAFNGSVDRQGRMVLPQALRQHAGITDEVVIIGQDTYFEIWSPQKWGQEDALGPQLPEIVESLEKGHA